MNTLTATIEFDFKGESYRLSSNVDIDKIIAYQDFYNAVYLSIANDNNIGLYTYEFEIMMDQNIIFSHATGCAIGCIDNNVLNLDLLKENYHKYLCKPVVAKLVATYNLNDKNLDIVNALRDAYLLGSAK